jgi:ribosomal protein S18 acetylase RimI-like enzyme
MADIILRPMQKKDITQAADIHRKVVREGLGQKMNYEIADLFESFIKKSPKTCIVAEKDSKVVGFIVGGIKEWGFGVERSGWMDMIEVDPKLMGEGIGSKLGESLIKYFKDKKIKKIYTTVQWDSGDLITFFKSIGFDKSSFMNLEYKSDFTKKERR